MLALLFEVTPKQNAYEAYLDIAAGLRPALAKQDGFLFIDRFRSLTRDGTILSHSLWRDEAALAAWRTLEPHHYAQVAGREKIFVDYRIRIAQVVQDHGPGKPTWRPARLTAYRDPAVHAPRYVVVATSTGAPSGEVEAETKPAESFESLNRAGEFLSLYDAADQDAALKLTDALLAERSAMNSTIGTIRMCEVERDYGMFDRREAPQYYRPVAREHTDGEVQTGSSEPVYQS